ncbi:MAG: hypothetical protein AAF489_13255 [Bacteroidota bacterium]
MKINYQNRIIAFVDVLGFKNLVFSNSNKKLNQYFNVIINDFKVDAKKYSLKYLLISDAIVVSVKNTEESFKAIVSILSKLQTKLLLHGILIRGGISFGDLYINRTQNIVVGAGMINAYQLESKAIYPRIIIDGRLIKYHYNNITNAVQLLNGRIRFKQPNPYKSDFAYLDFARLAVIFFTIGQLKKVVEYLRSEYYNSQNVYKYEWLRNQIILSLDDQISYMEDKDEWSSRDRRRLKFCFEIIEDLKKM